MHFKEILNVFSKIVWLLFMEENGLVIVYTGKGKGKTTAALGIALRATGYKKKICMIQFIKGSWHYGEMDSSKKLEPEFEMVTVGKGFVGIIDDKSPIEDHKKIAEEAIKISNEKILSKNYDIVILDEINYAVNLGLISVENVLNLIKSKPPKVDLILTGNYAKEEVIEIADLVTEMREIKHPFQRGIKAKKGIDF
jgi:cob(I)alamin adenosyltransferase